MIRLQAGELICDIEPALGGCIRALRLGDVPVLRESPPHLTSARQAASYPLVPFSNRIGHASLKWLGTLYPLVRSNAAEPHAIHGVGWQHEWAVLDETPTTALLSYRHPADGGWPFAFDCSQAFRVHARGIELTLSMTNQSHVLAPAGLGWHPYFVKRPGTRIAFEASGRWEMGDDKLPTHRIASQGISGTVQALDVDHCYDGWFGSVRLRDAVLTTRITSALKHLVVFTRPDRDSIAIEPVSHVNNAIALSNRDVDTRQLGLASLEPGQTFTATMAIEVERAK